MVPFFPLMGAYWPSARPPLSERCLRWCPRERGCQPVAKHARCPPCVARASGTGCASSPTGHPRPLPCPAATVASWRQVAAIRSCARTMASPRACRAALWASILASATWVTQHDTSILKVPLASAALARGPCDQPAAQSQTRWRERYPLRRARWYEQSYRAAVTSLTPSTRSRAGLPPRVTPSLGQKAGAGKAMAKAGEGACVLSRFTRSRL